MIENRLNESNKIENNLKEVQENNIFNMVNL